MRVLSYNIFKISRILCLSILLIQVFFLPVKGENEIEFSISTHPGKLESDDRADMICDYRGNVYLLQSNLNKIQKISQSSGVLAAIGGFGFGIGQFNNPTSIYTNDGGLNIYVLDSENRRIVHLNSDLKWIDEIQLESTYDNQILGDLTGLAVNSLGEFYISDPRNFRILKLDADGTLMGLLEGKGQLIMPGDMVFDKHDYLYVCSQSDNSIITFDDLGNLIEKFIPDSISQASRISYYNENLYILDDRQNSIHMYHLINKQTITLDRDICKSGNYSALVADDKAIMVYDSKLKFVLYFTEIKQ